MSKVIVTANAEGKVIVPSKNNPQWGHICVKQTRMVIEESGFARERTLLAWIPGKVAELEGFGWAPNQELKGKIIFKEQLTPFTTKEPERDYKIAGKTGVVCRIEGKPIYRKTFYSENPDAIDVPLQHDQASAEEIKIAYAKLKEEGVEISEQERTSFSLDQM